MNKYFYGVDYKKIHLYCKLKSLSTYHEVAKKYQINFDFDKEYLIVCDYRIDKTVDIVVEDFRGNKKTINLKYDDIDFIYFFENLVEQEKIYEDELPF